jgi:transcriptional regulator GlxA family with amidase domain
MSKAEAGMTIGFLLIERCSLLAFGAVSEPFHGANRHGTNQMPGRAHYGLRTLSIDGGPIATASGIRIVADGAIGDPAATADLDLLLLLAPIGRDMPDGLAAILRRIAAEGAPRGLAIGGVGGGPWIMAAAGLLDGHAATIHAALHDAFADAFPAVALDRQASHIIDRGRMSAGAGADAATALATRLILAHRGGPAAASSSNTAAALPTDAAAANGSAAPGLRARYGTGHRALLRALAAMEAHVAEPLDRAAIAAHADVTIRHLERLFRQQLGTTADRAYRDIRLDRARDLLRGTTMTAAEVARACGFATAPHFSRAFSTRFGITPAAERTAG